MCIMDWTLQYLVWITLISASSSRCNRLHTTTQSYVHDQRTLPETSHELNQGDVGRQRTLAETSRELHQGDLTGQRTLAETSRELHRGDLAGQQTLAETSRKLHRGDLAGRRRLAETSRELHRGDLPGQRRLAETSREQHHGNLAGQRTLPETSRELRQSDPAGQRTLAETSREPHQSDPAGQRTLAETRRELYQSDLAGQWTLPETSRELYQDDIAEHRTSETPLQLDYLQMIQELERLRFKPAENRVPRVENGTLKVINNFSAVHMASRRGVMNEQLKEQDVVVFPGPTSKSTFVPRIPEECLRTGICEDVPDYPEDRVASIIENLGDARDKFKVDELDTPEIAQRIGPPEEMELCDFALKVVIPKAAPDKDGNWHYILNQKDKPLQGFHVEICREDRSPCVKLVHFYSGYEASCKQKYVLRYMAGLNENGEMVEKPFKLPSCCSCVVRQKD